MQTNANHGTAKHGLNEYILEEEADFTNRLLPDHMTGMFEMSARAHGKKTGCPVRVYWIFEEVEEGQELDGYDYDDVDRVTPL